MNQIDQQAVLKREIDRLINRAADELDMSYFSMVGVLEFVKQELIESAAQQSFFDELKRQDEEE